MSLNFRAALGGFALLAASAALAQQAPPAAPQQSPNAFVTEQKLGEWRVSRLVGLDVLGADGEKLGDVREVLAGADGRIATVVVGVGGVLGVGERLVGVPYPTVEWASRSIGATRNPAANSETARTGAAADTTGSTSSRDAFVTRGGVPTHAVIRLTKAQLKAAPAFAYAGRASEAGPGPRAQGGQPGGDDPPPAAPRGATPPRP